MLDVSIIKRLTRFWIAGILILLTTNSFAAQAVKPLPLLVGGRVLVTTENNQKKYTYSWPGVYFEASFTGNDVDLHLNDSSNMLNVVVDDKVLTVLTRPGKTVYSLYGLGSGTHTIRLEKRTETFADKGSFEGFYIPQSEKAISLIQPARRIEFIGDSFTVGYGDTSAVRECTKDEIFSTTNTQVAFGPLVAKYFNAQYQINARSGLGIVRNAGGGNPETSFVSEYPYALSDHVEAYRDKWLPQVVIVVLGINDFNTPLNPNEKWKTREALQNDFVSTYTRFVMSIRKQHPKTHIILISPGDPSSEVTAQITRVVDELKKQGENKVTFKVSDTPLELTGCQYHASAKDHQTVANRIIYYIEKNPILWGN